MTDGCPMDEVVPGQATARCFLPPLGGSSAERLGRWRAGPIQMHGGCITDGAFLLDFEKLRTIGEVLRVWKDGGRWQGKLETIFLWSNDLINIEIRRKVWPL